MFEIHLQNVGIQNRCPFIMKEKWIRIKEMTMEKQWEKYRSVNTFANSISFTDTVNEIDHLMKSVIKIENQERKRQFKRSQQMNQEMER